MPEADDKIGRVVAERLRAKVEQAPIVVDHAVGSIDITISIGVAASKPKGFDPAELIRDADAALYRAKQAGRNRSESSERG
jgi:two-component system cell cycle response regulator